MSGRDTIEELAPAIGVRAARFPISALQRLADRSLADAAGKVDTKMTNVPADFGEAYARAMESQRAVLSKITIEDPAFGRALCITNEQLSRRVAASNALRGPRNKRSRHLETTLYRYLARAVWRIAPCDLWTGVAIGTWGEKTEISSAPARYAVGPDLLPYQTIVQALSRTSDYAARGLFKLNPTLAFDPDGCTFRYDVKRDDSSFAHHERRARPGLALLLRTLQGRPPASLEDHARELRRRGELDSSNIEDALMALRNGDLLVGGLAFPSQFSSPWAALLLVAADLRSDHARIWRSAVVRLRRVCRRLERALETITTEDLLAALECARSVPARLASELNVAPPKLPRSVLRCDTKLPYSFAFGSDAKAALFRAVAEYDGFERRHGLDSAARAAHRAYVLRDRDRVSGQEPTPAVPTVEWPWRSSGADEALGERLCEWATWLRTNESPRFVVDAMNEDATREIQLSPIGGLVLRPRHEGFEIIGSTTEICAVYGRYGALWYGLAVRGRDRFPNHPLHSWYETTLARVAREANIDVVEYVGPCEQAPNGLARPTFTFPKWDRWGTSTALPMGDARVLPRGTSVPVVRTTAHERSISVACFTPLDLGLTDAFVERLLLSSFREMPTWISPFLPMDHEVGTVGSSPRIELASGNGIRARRTVLTGSVLQELVSAEPARRFVLWQALARERRWPPLVVVARDEHAPLPVARDSPLALDAALEGAREGTRFLIVEEPNDDPWLVDIKGQAFIAELIVPFLRREHAWNDMVPS